MDFWQKVQESLTPQLIGFFLALILGVIVYRRHLYLNRKIELVNKYEIKLDEIYKTISEIIKYYHEAVQELKKIGDKYRELPNLSSNQAAVKQIQEDIDKKFAILEKLVNKAEKSQENGTEIINLLSSDPIIARRFSIAAETLKKVHNNAGDHLYRVNQLLIPINTLPPEVSGGGTVRPDLFRAIEQVINTSIQELRQYQLYLKDAQKIIYNELVGGVLLFKKHKPGYMEERKVLTKWGIRDYTVERGRLIRLKIFFRFLWG